MSYSGYGCANLPYSVVYLSFVVTWGCCGGIVCILGYAIFQFFYSKLAASGIVWKYKCLCVGALILLSLSSLCVGVSVTFIANCAENRFDNPVYMKIIAIWIGCFAFSLLLIYTLMTLRVLHVLHGTVFQLSVNWNRYFRYFIIFQFVFLVLTFVVLLGYRISLNYLDTSSISSIPFILYQLSTTVGSIWVVLYIIHFILILVIFYNRLRLMAIYLYGNPNNDQTIINMTRSNSNKQISSIPRLSSPRISIETNKENEEKKMELFGLAIRVSLLCSIAVGSSILMTIWMVIDSRIEKSNLMEIIFDSLLYPTDMVINAICLILQWPFSTNLYYKICHCCDNCVRKCCHDGFSEISQSILLKNTTIIKRESKETDIVPQSGLNQTTQQVSRENDDTKTRKGAEIELELAGQLQVVTDSTDHS